MLGASSSALERGIGNTVAQYAYVKTSPLAPSRVDLKRTVNPTPEAAASSVYMLNYIAENWWKHCSRVYTLELALANGYLNIVKVILVEIEIFMGLGFLDPVRPRRIGSILRRRLLLDSSLEDARERRLRAYQRHHWDAAASYITQMLSLQHVMSITSYARTSLACHLAHPNLLELYLGSNTDGDLDRNCPTMVCLRSQRDNIYLWDTPIWKAAALLCASATGRTDAVERILCTNAIASDRGDPIHGTDSLPLLAFTPGLGVISVDLGLRPLLAAFGEGWDGVVKLLLDAGRRALRDAADRCVEKVITGGNLKICTGKNMLQTAAEKGHVEMVKVLLPECDDVDYMDTKNHTALYYACVNGKVGVVQVLAAAGASVDVRHSCRNFRCIEQMTPLYHACHSRDKGLVEVLLASSADRNILDSKGHTLTQNIEEAMSTIRRLRSGDSVSTSNDVWVEPADPKPDSDALVVYEEILVLFQDIPPSTPQTSWSLGRLP